MCDCIVTRIVYKEISEYLFRVSYCYLKVHKQVIFFVRVCTHLLVVRIFQDVPPYEQNLPNQEHLSHTVVLERSTFHCNKTWTFSSVRTINLLFKHKAAHRLIVMPCVYFCLPSIIKLHSPNSTTPVFLGNLCL